MKSVFVLHFNHTKYVDSFDFSSREYSVIDDPYNAEHFNEGEASYYAERLGCKYKELLIPEM